MMLIQAIDQMLNVDNQLTQSQEVTTGSWVLQPSAGLQFTVEMPNE